MFAMMLGVVGVFSRLVLHASRIGGWMMMTLLLQAELRLMPLTEQASAWSDVCGLTPS
jgi:hypothetical protein